jgi:hypothetical protein
MRSLCCYIEYLNVCYTTGETEKGYHYPSVSIICVNDIMASQLNRMGARVTELPHRLEILGGIRLVGTDVNSHTDHRIAKQV